MLALAAIVTVYVVGAATAHMIWLLMEYGDEVGEIFASVFWPIGIPVMVAKLLGQRMADEVRGYRQRKKKEQEELMKLMKEMDVKIEEGIRKIRS